MKEVWKTINRYEGLYEVSNVGRVASFKSGTRVILKVNSSTRDGYFRIMIGHYRNAIKNRKSYLVHRLVAEAFIRNPENKPEVNHKDGNKANNSIKNLEWCTKSENHIHARRTGLRDSFSIQGEKQWKAKLNQHQVERIRLIHEVTPTLKHREIAAMFGVCSMTIFRILNRKSWKHA